MREASTFEGNPTRLEFGSRSWDNSRPRAA